MEKPLSESSEIGYILSPAKLEVLRAQKTSNHLVGLGPLLQLNPERGWVGKVFRQRRQSKEGSTVRSPKTPGMQQDVVKEASEGDRDQVTVGLNHPARKGGLLGRPIS